MTYKHIKVQLPLVPMGQGEELFPQSKEAMQEYWLAMSAPDLLAALEFCAGTSYITDAREVAQAAIAKATGGSA